MPIYAYQCQACGHEFDAMQKISDAPLTQCPSCEEDTLKKQLTAPAFRLSGSGWYETDFKKDKKKNLAGDSTESKEGGGKTEKPAAESKPAETKPSSEAS
jgi:putative FmdB family regulatory protein